MTYRKKAHETLCLHGKERNKGETTKEHRTTPRRHPRGWNPNPNPNPNPPQQKL